MMYIPINCIEGTPRKIGGYYRKIGGYYRKIGGYYRKIGGYYRKIGGYYRKIGTLIGPFTTCKMADDNIEYRGSGRGVSGLIWLLRGA